MLEPALLSSFTLSHLLSTDMSTQYVFQAEAPLLLTHRDDQKPWGYHELELTILTGRSGRPLLGVLVNLACWEGKTSSDSSDGKQKMLV